MRIDNSITAIITGAGSGIGAETARYFAAQGMKVALWDMNMDGAERVAKEIGGLALQTDVTREDSVMASLESTVQKLGVPRVLVNCAGVLFGKKIIGKEGAADLGHFEKTIAVNLVGTFNTMRIVAARMANSDAVSNDGERGVIINTASIAAFEGQMGQVAYSASKGGIVGMTLPAARDLARDGIRVMAIAPGAVETPMIAGVRDDIRQAIESNIPFPQRMAEPQEFARLALHIVENSYLNGTVIRLDGASRLN